MNVKLTTALVMMLAQAACLQAGPILWGNVRFGMTQTEFLAAYPEATTRGKASETQGWKLESVKIGAAYFNPVVSFDAPGERGKVESVWLWIDPEWPELSEDQVSEIVELYSKKYGHPKRDFPFQGTRMTQWESGGVLIGLNLLKSSDEPDKKAVLHINYRSAMEGTENI